MLYILYGHGVNSSRIYAVNFEHFQHAKGDALAFARATMLVFLKITYPILKQQWSAHNTKELTKCCCCS
jgi:hypothetical protein